jgi:hypothetical protein
VVEYSVGVVLEKSIFWFSVGHIKAKVVTQNVLSDIHVRLRSAHQCKEVRKIIDPEKHFRVTIIFPSRSLRRHVILKFVVKVVYLLISYS